MGKLSIPSFNLMIVGGPYKGYFAEYRERLRQGESLVVVIGATGQTASIPIQNIHFLMDDGRVLKYAPVQTGLGLVEVGSGEPGQIVTVKEKKDSPSKFSPVFLPETVSEDIEFSEDDEMSGYEDEDVEEYIVKKLKDVNIGDNNSNEKNIKNMRSDMKKNIRKNIETMMSEDIDISTGDAPVVMLRENNIVAKNKSSDRAFILTRDLFNLLGFEMDDESVAFHSETLKKLLSHEALAQVDLRNISILKTMVMAYIFIHVNNMGLGYPLNFEGIEMRPNDDPRFISEVCYKKGYTNGLFDIRENIRILSIISGTSIIPATVNTNTMINSLSSRFSLMRVSKNKSGLDLGPVIEGVGIQETLRFPLYPESQKTSAELKAKQIITSKILAKIEKNGSKDTERKILSNFLKNMSSYIKGPVFSRLNNNPALAESRLLMPYIEEYRDILKIEKNRFYDGKVKTKTPMSEDKKRLVSQMVKRYKDMAESMETPDNIRFAATEIYKNIPVVVSMNNRDFEIFKAGMISSSDEYKEIIKELVAVRIDINNSSKLRTLKDTHKRFSEYRESYKKRLMLSRK